MSAMCLVTELTSYRRGNVNYGLSQGIHCCIYSDKAENLSDYQMLTTQMCT